MNINEKAPAFEVLDQDGKAQKLSDYKGKWVLLYFYPKDNTPGCITEAEHFRDAAQDFEKRNVQVLGVSTDSVESHKKFADKFNLNFPLLADTDKEVVNAYGVWGEKKFMGKTYMGTNRDSFLIDPDGNIAKVYEKVKPKEHVQEVLADIDELQ